jgi:DNA-binding transcriptional LysR family regulator
MAELETRELEYFVAVAEELHFRRAAERLSVSQPAVSKTIRQVEARLGVTLIDRSGRQVALTPAGETLLERGRQALAAVSAAARSARRTAGAGTPLRLVIKPGGDARLLPGILEAYAGAVDIVFSGTTDRADQLRDGRADVGLLYVPYDDVTGLSYEPLLCEGRVAVLPPGHPLGSRAELGEADLADETIPRWADRDDPGGGPEVADLPQLVQMISLGKTIAVLPRSLADLLPPGLTLVPVHDAPASVLAVAWSAHDRRPSVAAFVSAALTASVHDHRHGDPGRDRPATSPARPTGNGDE